ncbi:MAG TPA: twin-arginine translocase TatA/TatE family subunit [Terriglobales bacterium]|nr:twin-arginine translocase TatA/TatE family subunit [Terriglobales bacterium]
MEGLFQPLHLVVLLVLGGFIFGPRRLPELGKGLGDGIRNFKDAFRAGKHTSESH